VWWRALIVVTVAMFAITVSPARGQAVGESIIGAATAEIQEPGSLTPTGNGRFATQGRVYAGTSLGRSVEDSLASCFTGRLTSIEEWLLESQKMSGTHQSTIRIRPERGTVTLRLSGEMDELAASGAWEVVRATGRCTGLEGEGRYTATYSDRVPHLRLTFAGLARKS
jgi:hypothetical protein